MHSSRCPLLQLTKEKKRKDKTQLTKRNTYFSTIQTGIKSLKHIFYNILLM